MSEFGGIPERYKNKNCAVQGGMGDVGFFYDEILERDVAIKTMQDVSEMSRLYDEINALLSLRSKHVVQVYDLLKTSEDEVAIVMEFIGGDDLTAKSFPEAKVEEYFRTMWQIASGLSDIHEQGIIHRDIKPNNMKLDDEGILKIFDFGLSRQIDFNAETSGFRGTFGFAAPEQYCNDQFEFTSGIDVYAFSVTALQFLNRKLPPELLARPPVEVNKNPFSATWLDKFEGLSEMLWQALSHDITLRPSMGDLKSEIEKYLLKDSHQALVIIGKNNDYLNKDKRRVGVKFGKVGAFAVSYNGHSFLLGEISGKVYINNSLVTGTTKLPRSCVITIGEPERKSNRAYVTFDISNPEVSL